MRFHGKFRPSSFQIIVLGFGVLILSGTLLLSLPVASLEPGGAGWMDCLFTATSAVCVTGLVVRDTATFWSPFGQAVILLLIQIGGMGVVTTAVFVAFLSGRRIGLMERSVMQESISAPQVGGIVRLTRFILGVTFAVEGIGALLLMGPMIHAFGWGKGTWYAFFHSISAFCNAGFDLMGVRGPCSSLTGFMQDPLVNLTVVLLITVGGIGFLVWDDLREHGLQWKRYRLQTKTVMLTSAALVLLPMLWMFFVELDELPLPRRILPSLFQSVTLRTAGFNTVDLTRVSPSGQALMIVWMLVGGSPGSTAGGMKTTTLAVLLMTAVSVVRRRESVSFLGRRVADETVHNTVALVIMYVMLFVLGGQAISLLEKLPMMACLFETASALGTVGLSLGITGGLSVPSRLILIILMFWGRVGGLTLIYATQSVRRPVKSTLPLEKITVG